MDTSKLRATFAITQTTFSIIFQSPSIKEMERTVLRWLSIKKQKKIVLKNNIKTAEQKKNMVNIIQAEVHSIFFTHHLHLIILPVKLFILGSPTFIGKHR